MSINTTKICDDLEIADEGTTVIAYNKNNEKVVFSIGFVFHISSKYKNILYGKVSHNKIKF